MTSIQKDKRVHIHCTLKNESGETIDSSVGKEPLAYVHGHRHIVPGLEDAIEGCSVGESVSVIVSPEDGYGPIDESLMMDVEKERFGDDFSLKVGDFFYTQTPQGMKQAQILDIKADTVRVNLNHELAGKVLYFDIQVLGVEDQEPNCDSPNQSCECC